MVSAASTRGHRFLEHVSLLPVELLFVAQYAAAVNCSNSCRSKYTSALTARDSSVKGAAIAILVRLTAITSAKRKCRKNIFNGFQRSGSDCKTRKRSDRSEETSKCITQKLSRSSSLYFTTPVTQLSIVTPKADDLRPTVRAVQIIHARLRCLPALLPQRSTQEVDAIAGRFIGNTVHLRDQSDISHAQGA